MAKDRVLFIEDDTVDRMVFIKAVTAGECGFSLDVASSFREAREYLMRKSYSAVVSDYFLGDGTAMDIIRTFPDVPVVIVTGSSDMEITVESMKSGAYDFILKDPGYLYCRAIPVTVQTVINRKRIENELDTYRNNLENTVIMLNNEIYEKNLLCKDLEEKARELESFIYTVSHDLKAPLVVLGGYSSLLLKEFGDIFDDEARDYLRIIQSNVERMEKLIHDLLELSRIGRIITNKEEIDMSDLLASIQEEYALQLAEKKIEFKCSTSLPNPLGDTGQVKQVLNNLIGNAIKFIGEGENPVIEVGADRYDEDYYCYYVRDTGIGIDPLHHEKVFKEFHRVCNADIEGTGIGLAIVKKIIENHGGSIWVESELGAGCNFYFTLPALKSLHGHRKKDGCSRL